MSVELHLTKQSVKSPPTAKPHTAKMKASVSVLLPYRDSEQTIEECIQSVQAQKLKDWELLAVNDHSSDNSESIVRDYANKDGRIKMLRSREGNRFSLKSGNITCQLTIDSENGCRRPNASRATPPKSTSWERTLVRALFPARLNTFQPRQTTRVVMKNTWTGQTKCFLTMKYR